MFAKIKVMLIKFNIVHIIRKTINTKLYGQKGYIMSELNIKVSFPEERQMKEFIKMLAWMELCGNIGHSTDFLVNLDGDGNTRPKFKFENKELQQSYDTLRKTMSEKYDTTPTYRDNIDIKISID